MDLAALIDGIVAIIVMGGALMALLALLLLGLGLGRVAGLSDEALEAYAARELGLVGDEDNGDKFDADARRWIAERRAS